MPFMATTLSQSARRHEATNTSSFSQGLENNDGIPYSWPMAGSFNIMLSVFLVFPILERAAPWLERFAQQIENITISIQQEIGNRPYVIGMDLYKSASGLAFYGTLRLEKNHASETRYPVLETAGRNLFGQEAVMYNYWSSTTLKGKPLIIVSPNREDLEAWWLFGKRRSVSEVKTLEGLKIEQKLKPLYYRLVNVNMVIIRNISVSMRAIVYPPITLVTELRNEHSNHRR